MCPLPEADGPLFHFAETRHETSSETVSAQRIDVELQRMTAAFSRNVTRDLREDQERAAEGKPMLVPVVTSNELHTAIEQRTCARVQRDLDSLKRQYLERFGTQLNADNASELFPEYTASRECRALNGPAVRKRAAAVIDGLYGDLLAQAVGRGRIPLVIFTGGGNGSGKSSALPHPDDSEFGERLARNLHKLRGDRVLRARNPDGKVHGVKQKHEQKNVGLLTSGGCNGDAPTMEQ